MTNALHCISLTMLFHVALYNEFDHNIYLIDGRMDEWMDG